MAKSVLELAVGTGQWDAGLKKAKSSLDNFIQANGGLQIALDKDSDKIQEFVKMMGQMDSTAKTAKGQMNDYKSTIEQLTMQYNRMTDAQKKTIGQDYLNTIDQLKQKYQAAKNEIKSIGDSMNNTGGILGQLKEKFTINIDAVKLFNMGLTASKAALDVAKDAFFASEQNVDEWGRVVAASESVYEGFLTAINNGDISGYLTRIDQIVQAAREAYNELDKLGTMRTIQGPQFSKQEAENTRMRMMIMTGRYIAPAAGSGMKAAMAEGTVLTPEQIRRIEQKLESGMKSIGALTKNELAQTGKAIDAYYNKLAVTNGMSRSEFRQGTSSWDEFSRRMQGYEEYKRWDAQARAEFARQGGRGYVDFDKSNPYAEYRKWGTFRVDKMGENSFNDLVGLIKQQQQQTNQLYSQMGQTYRTINRAEGVTVRDILKGGKGGAGGSGGGGTNVPTYAEDSIAAMEAEVSQLTKLWKEAGAAVRGEYADALNEAKLRLDEVTGKTKKITFDSEAAAKQIGYTRGDREGLITNSSLGRVADLPTVGDGLSKETMDYIKKLQQGGNDVSKSWQIASKAISAAGNALGSLNSPAIDIMVVIGQAIATIGLAYAETLAKDKTSKSNIWSFIAAAAAATVSMASTIASLHSSTGYAQGGKIEGNSYSGDNIAGLVDGSQLVGLNAGEIVLNQAQQSNVASGLRGGALGGMRLQTKVKGTELLIWVDNALAQSGRGELVTWGT